ADDLSLPDRLRRQVEFLDAHPAVGILGTANFLELTGEADRQVVERPLADSDIRWTMLFKNALVHTSVTFRRKLVAEVGGYDEEYVRSQDYDLWTRVLAHSEGANLDEPLVVLRWREDAITALHAEEQLETSRRISIRNIRELCALSTEEESLPWKIQSWRVWKSPGAQGSGLPPAFKASDAGAVELLARLLTAFCGAPGAREERRHFGRMWARAILHRLPATGWEERSAKPIVEALSPISPMAAAWFKLRARIL
ncbi:hypothetical protein ACFLSJ_08940, partial [Verrucomicrobiota bacterium]